MNRDRIEAAVLELCVIGRTRVHMIHLRDSWGYCVASITPDELIDRLCAILLSSEPGPDVLGMLEELTVAAEVVMPERLVTKAARAMITAAKASEPGPLEQVIEQALLRVADNVAKHIIGGKGWSEDDGCFQVDLRQAQAEIVAAIAAAEKGVTDGA